MKNFILSNLFFLSVLLLLITPASHCAASQLKVTVPEIGVTEFLCSKSADDIDLIKLKNTLIESLSNTTATKDNLNISAIPVNDAAIFFDSTDHDLAIAGKKIGMQKLVITYLYFLDSKIILSIKIIDCVSLRKEANYFASCAGAEELEDKIKIIARKILLNLALRPDADGAKIKPEFSSDRLKDFIKIPYKTSQWEIIKLGGGCELKHLPAKIKISFTPQAANDSKHNVFGIFFISRNEIEGDFDIILDYSLVEWPAQNGTRIGMGIFAKDTFLGRNKWYQQAERISSTRADSSFVPFNGDAYLVDTADDNIKGAMEATGNAGKIRISRTKDTFRAYCFRDTKNPEWLNIYSSTTKNGPVKLFMGAWNHDYCFTKQFVEACFAPVEISSKIIKNSNEEQHLFYKKIRK